MSHYRLDETPSTFLFHENGDPYQDILINSPRALPASYRPSLERGSWPALLLLPKPMTGAMVLIMLCKLLLGAVPGTGLCPVWSVEVSGSVREEFFVVKDSGPAVTWPRDLSAADPDLPKMHEY